MSTSFNHIILFQFTLLVSCGLSPHPKKSAPPSACLTSRIKKCHRHGQGAVMTSSCCFPGVVSRPYQNPRDCHSGKQVCGRAPTHEPCDLPQSFTANCLNDPVSSWLRLIPPSQRDSRRVQWTLLLTRCLRLPIVYRREDKYLVFSHVRRASPSSPRCHRSDTEYQLFGLQWLPTVR